MAGTTGYDRDYGAGYRAGYSQGHRNGRATERSNATERAYSVPTTTERAAERGRADGIMVAHGIERAPWPMVTAQAERAYMDARAEHYRSERERIDAFGPTLPK